MANGTFTSRFVEYATIAPGQVHHWFFDPLGWSPVGWIWTFNAFPYYNPAEPTRMVEITEAYFITKGNDVQGSGEMQFNVVIRNNGPNDATYFLVGAAIPRTDNEP
jgi:hypothetical protein